MSSVDVWKLIQKDLERKSSEVNHREGGFFKLIIAIILSAGKDKDMEYLGSDRFYYDCSLISLSPDVILSLMRRVWRYKG